MTSHTILVVALAAMLAAVTSADLEVPSFTDDSEGVRNQDNDRLVEQQKLLVAKICELRSTIKELENKIGVKTPEVTSPQPPCCRTMDQMSEEMSRLRVEKRKLDEDVSRLRKLRSDELALEINIQTQNQNRLEALSKKTIALQYDNLQYQFIVNQLNQSNWILRQEVENCKVDKNHSRLARLFASENENEKQDLQTQISVLQAQMLNISETLFKTEECKKKITELGMVNLDATHYYFANLSFTKTWHEADSFCKSHGLELVGVESAQEHNAITAHLVQRLGSSWNNHYWLGGNDLSSEGRWVWSSTGQPVTFTAWVSGEPNGGTTENCMFNTHGASALGKWHDYACTYNAPFICEMKQFCI